MCGIAGLYHPEQPRPLSEERVAASHDANRVEDVLGWP